MVAAIPGLLIRATPQDRQRCFLVGAEAFNRRRQEHQLLPGMSVAEGLEQSLEIGKRLAIDELGSRIWDFSAIGDAEHLPPLPLLLDGDRSHAKHLGNISAIKHPTGALSHIVAEARGLLARSPDRLEISWRFWRDVARSDCKCLAHLNKADRLLTLYPFRYKWVL
jgi:hypothetical protein